MKQLIGILIASIFVIGLVNGASQTGTAVVTATFYKNNSVTVDAFEYMPEPINTDLPFMGRGNYSITVHNITKQPLLHKSFHINFQRFVIYMDGRRQPRNISKTTHQLQIALPSQYRYITIEHKNETKATIQLGEEICNNDKVCEPDFGETATLCPRDCNSSDVATCGNGVCERTQGENASLCSVDCESAEEQKQTVFAWWVYAGIVTVLGGLAITLAIVKKEQR